MKFMCMIGKHAWSGCKCDVCGKLRNEGHQWDGCKCIRCGRRRHDWETLFRQASWIECVNSPGSHCTDCYNSIQKQCSGGTLIPGRAEYRCRKCGEMKTEVL